MPTAVNVWKPVLAVSLDWVFDWLVVTAPCPDVPGATPLDGLLGGYGVGAALASAGTLSNAVAISASNSSVDSVR